MVNLLNRIKQNKWKLLILLAIIIIIILFMSRDRNATPQYENVEIVRTEVVKSVSASGVVKSFSEASLSFSSAGEVTNVTVRKGDSVKKGALLAHVYNYDTYLSSQANEDARDVALQDLKLYKENYETNMDAVGGADEYRINVNRLQELVDRAENTYQSSLAALRDFYIYAPFDATVTDVLIDLGETASPTSPAIKIADLENLYFEVVVDQEDFGLVKLDQTAQITLDSYDGVMFDATVAELPYFADENGDFTVKLKILPNSEYSVLLGMEGDASIIIEKTDGDTQAVFFDAVFEEDAKPYVWVLKEDKLEKLYIDTGLEGDLYTEVKTDLSNQTVVTPVTD